MGSPLDYISSEGFRKKLITRNLVPYAKSPYKATPPITYEVVQSDLSVIDSPDGLIDTPVFANKLYPLNEWGADGGYKQAIDPTGLLNTISNQGEYGPGQQDAHIIDEGYAAIKFYRPLNAYADTTRVFDSADAFSTLETVRPDQDRQTNSQPYVPLIYVPSSYTSVSLLLSSNPQGTNGLLSQDSYIARLGAVKVKQEFQDRIGREILRQTLGRVNILNVNSTSNLVNILTGNVPLIEPNYQITIPNNPIIAATDFALRLAGSTTPFSLIPGSYFDPAINPPQPTTIGQALLGNPLAAVGNFVSKLLSGGKTGSQLFYNNTGAGQKSLLFKNINFNRYKPSYDRTALDRLGGAIVGTETNNANFYIGSTTSEPSRVFSPSGELPANAFGQELQVPVYGPSELAQLYEGPSKEIRLGANGPTYSNGGGIEGGFTWVSPKYKGNAGKKVGIGGEILQQDSDFKPSSYDSTESTERTFREGSILDDTQRLINSQPQGGKRLQHVGNAIDQVSKVFHDGYKEMTKGSRVLTYIGSIGQEVGTEYCRVFAKDIPYLQYNDLQKVDGVVTEGRRFSYSVLDKTYNLNIAPNKQEGGQDSTNIIGNTNTAYAKKYMFSLENLAWVTSNTPGFSVSDLPVCERGPNGGRVMWFPPYGLTFSENVQANWQTNDFIGRPEPIYTYKNTTRTGSLTWKIVVDHPSVLNVIVNKVLANETNKTRIDSILDSFFAGCRKYDLYELAKKYYTIGPNDLFQIQQAITSKELTKEQMEYVTSTITTIPQVAGQPSGNIGGAGGIGNNGIPFDLKKYENLGFYFSNDYPKPNKAKTNEEFLLLTPNYNVEYVEYKGEKPTYSRQTNGKELDEFYDTVITPNYEVAKQLAIEIANLLKQNPKGIITLYINSSCSAPQSKDYNTELSKRRIASTIKFFTENSNTMVYVKEQRLNLVSGLVGGEGVTISQVQKSKTRVPPYNLVSNETTINCGDNDVSVVGGDTQVGSKDIYTTNAMSCRRAYISKIITSDFGPPSEPIPKKTTVVTGNVITKTETVPVLETTVVQRDNISKRVLRALLSECDYFETIKEETPMVYDNLRDKLKFFQPAFHSITPEGLNSRLTFLQQCMRPGDTIPTIKNIGGKPTLDYNDAQNTAFGTPPVLVLRIGDFYNTKIIPTGLALTYENLDINPEGIGIQPMIANVTMQFNFVGGSGLKESVDKLQNALTFNYYANTEMYDDRSDPTDASYKVIDKDFLKSAIDNGVQPPTINQAAPNNGQTNENTIGTILTNEISSTGQTGTITYGEFMTKFVNETQNYFTNVVNKTKETVNQYNNALRQQWMLERTYTDGKFLITKDKKTVLFGKPNNLEKRTNDIFAVLSSEVNNGDEGFIEYITNNSFGFSYRLKNQVKENYLNIIKNKRGSYLNASTTISQSMVGVQQSYIGYIARVNTITYPSAINTGTDGLQQKNGVVRSYVTLGTTGVDKSSVDSNNSTLVELSNDIRIINDDIKEFNEIISSATTFVYTGDNQKYTGTLVFNVPVGSPYIFLPAGQEVFIPFSKNKPNIDSPNSTFEKNVFRRVYMILSDDIVDSKRYETFKNAMIGNVIKNPAIIGKGKDNIGDVFDAYWDKIAKPLFIEETSITKEFIAYMEKEKLKKFLKYTPFGPKERLFKYTTELADTSGQQKLIKGLGATQNQNTNNKTWNDEPSGDVYISKAKLN